MGPIAISFGLACVATFVAACVSMSRVAIAGAVVLAVMWGITKIYAFPSDSEPGLQADAVCSLLGGCFGVLAMASDMGSRWRRVFTASMLASALATFGYSWSLYFGFAPPKPLYEGALNMLYGIAIAANFSTGLQNGRRLLLTLLSGGDHVGARPGFGGHKAREER
jgi:hypothetical protein